MYNFLLLGYHKYKDEPYDIKNNYSLSFEDLENYENYENEYVEADICHCNSEWKPIGLIYKKDKQSLCKRVCNYMIFGSSISCIGLLCYLTISSLYH